MTMYRPTVAEIDLTAIRDNLRAIRACIPLKAQVIGIVKADAYGHGAARVAAVLEQEQVRLLAVATPDEAVELRESGIMAEILVFGHSPADFVPYAVTNNVALTTVNRATTAMYGAAAGMHTVRLHYKVDTGMGRAGVLVDDATEQILRSAAVPNVSIVGLYSHFACAESDPEFTALQAARFAAVVREVRAGGLQPAMVHLANSAGMFTSPGAMLDAVRPGILLYGCPPVPAPYGRSSHCGQSWKWSRNCRQATASGMGGRSSRSGRPAWRSSPSGTPTAICADCPTRRMPSSGGGSRPSWVVSVWISAPSTSQTSPPRCPAIL